MKAIENFMSYAIEHYDNPSCASLQEFDDDIKKFKYVVRLLRRWKLSGEMNERLILNHIILIHNVFGVATAPLLYHRVEKEFWPQIKTFLLYLNYVVDGEDEIHQDIQISSALIDI